MKWIPGASGSSAASPTNASKGGRFILEVFYVEGASTQAEKSGGHANNE
ncbi:MAG: hypothetical protein KGJ32_12880 [Xanthomonadaceae bacterium]|nr:hypothetical protein [Xanthomonadaceae bacterium]